MHLLYPRRRNVAAQVAEELKTVTYAKPPPMEERRNLKKKKMTHSFGGVSLHRLGTGPHVLGARGRRGVSALGGGATRAGGRRRQHVTRLTCNISIEYMTLLTCGIDTNIHCGRA